MVVRGDFEAVVERPNSLPEYIPSNSAFSYLIYFLFASQNWPKLVGTTEIQKAVAKLSSGRS